MPWDGEVQRRDILQGDNRERTRLQRHLNDTVQVYKHRATMRIIGIPNLQVAKELQISAFNSDGVPDSAIRPQEMFCEEDRVFYKGH